MKIKRLLLTAFAFALVGSSAMTIAEDTAAKDGKTVFEEQKCAMCHSVTSASIESKKKSGAIDLSLTGDKADAALLKKYLKKEEAIGGKKHPASFKGTDAELEIIATWLGEMKTKK